MGNISKSIFSILFSPVAHCLVYHFWRKNITLPFVPLREIIGQARIGSGGGIWTRVLQIMGLMSLPLLYPALYVSIFKSCSGLYSRKEPQDVCLRVVTRTGVEPVLQPWKSRVLATWPTGRMYLINLADLRHTNCLTFIHIQPIGR